MKNIYRTDLVHSYVKILLHGRRETYIVQKTLLVEKICNSRIKRLIWGSRGNNHFFSSEIHLSLCLQLYFQKPSLYTRLVRSTIGYSLCMEQVKCIHYQLLLCALEFACFSVAIALRQGGGRGSLRQFICSTQFILWWEYALHQFQSFV